jgi:hypothetical protein
MGLGQPGDVGGDTGLLLGLAGKFTAVGPLNSHLSPNPNGLVLVADLLLRLGDLRVASFVISMAQAAAAVWLARGLTRTWPQSLVVAAPLVWSSALRATSIELWAQWFLVTLDMIALAALIDHVRRPRIWCFAVSLAAGALAAAAYLPGVVPFTVLILLWGVRLWMLDAAQRARHLMLAALPIGVALALVTVAPYALTVDLSTVSSGSGRGLVRRAEHSVVEGLIAIPWLLRQQAMYFPRWLGREAPAALSKFAWAPGLAAAAGVGAWTASRRRRVDIGARSLAFACTFAIGVFSLTPLLSGFVITRDGRNDLGFQAWPIVVGAAFGSAFLVRRSAVRRPAMLVAGAAALAFAAQQAFAGDALRRAMIDGQVPNVVPTLREVRATVDRLVRDNEFQTTIAVDYRHELEWFPEFRLQHRRWIPVPLPGGIVFDHELARRAVHNVCSDGCAPGIEHYVLTAVDAPSSPAVIRSAAIGAYRIDLVRPARTVASATIR